ncbi:MAG: hypothetical protein WBW94_01600 [Anaerolineales bacterium]
MTNQIEPRRPRLNLNHSPIPASPIHPLSALVTILLDNLFDLPELAGPEVWVITAPIVGGLCFAVTTLVQRYLAKDEWGPAIAKGLVMGVVAGVPFSVTGTATGGMFLAWAGLHQWVQLPSSRNESDSDDHEIIDANPK